MTISVIVPNYNHAGFLTEALKAIVNQTYPPIEILVIDDCSTDNSVEIIRSLQKKYPLIQLHKQKKNQGPIEAVNKGISLAKGKYLVFASADDHVFESFFSEAMKFFTKNKSLGLVCGDLCHFMNRKPYKYEAFSTPLSNEPVVFSKDMICKTFRDTLFFIHSNVSIYRSECVRELGGYNPKLGSLSDWFLNLQIAHTYGVGYVPGVFGGFRIHDLSYSSRQKASREARNRLCTQLMIEIKKQPLELRKFYKSSGALGQIGLWMLEYLFFHPRFWTYLPFALYKKGRFYLGKKTRCFSK